MPLLRPDEVDAIRATVETTLSTPCTILRSVSGSWVAQGTVQGDITPEKATVHLPGLPALTALQSTRITLPWDADVRAGDRIGTASLGTFGVERIEDPTSDMFNFSAVVHALLLYGVTGAALYVTMNAQVGLSRFIRVTHEDPDTHVVTTHTALTPVASGVSCFVDDISLELKTAGVAPEFVLSLVVDSAVDIRDGDQVTGLGAVNAVHRTTTLQIQHVARHQYAGADYKHAHITAIS